MYWNHSNNVEQLLFYLTFNKTDIFILVGYNVIIIRSETFKGIFKNLVEWLGSLSRTFPGLDPVLGLF